MKVFALLNTDGSLEKITHVLAEAERWTATGNVESGEADIKEGSENYEVKTKNGIIHLGPGLRSYVPNPAAPAGQPAPVQRAKATVAEQSAPVDPQPAK